MKIVQYILATSLAWGLCSCSSISSQFGKLGNVAPSAASIPSALPLVSVDDMTAKFDESILAIGLARKSFFEAQWLLSGALGCKEEADKMLSSAGILQDGKIAQPSTQEEIVNARNVAFDLNKKIEESLSGTVTLNEKQKKYFIAAKKRYMKGLLEEGGQIVVLAVLIKQMKDQVDQLRGNPFNPSNIRATARLTTMIVPTAKLISFLPGDIKEMYTGWRLFRKVGADNNIEVEDVDIDQFLSGAD